MLTDSLLLIYFLSSQSSLSVGSDLDLMDVPSPAYPLRRSWDANQEGVGIEVNGAFLGTLQQLVPSVNLSPSPRVSRC